MDIPGPPRTRRRATGGTLRDRVQALRSAEKDGLSPAALWRLTKDVVLLVKDLAADPRVPRRDQLVAVAAVAYIASPLDLVSITIPVLGQLDDLGVLAWSLRRLLAAAGFDLIYELWRGTDEGLALVLGLAGIDE